MESTLPRVLEPELMDSDEEALDYDAIDHVAVNARFCEDLLAELPNAANATNLRVLDVGTGTARIPIELCRRSAHVRVVAIDLAESMLRLAKENLAREGFVDRVRILREDAKAMGFDDGAFSVTTSNSIVHHIPEPRAALSEMWRVTAPGGLLFVRDLLRPGSREEVSRLVALYQGSPPPEANLAASWTRQREQLRASLCAALTVDEIVAMVVPLGIAARAVRVTSDRHWTLVAHKP